MNPKPKKPDRPLAVIMFPAKGTPYHVIEHLPRTQKELETEVGRKFVGALNSRNDGAYTNLRVGPEPTDLLCTGPGNQDIGIQVTEVIDPNARNIRTMRETYTQALLSTHWDTILKFTECDVRFVDDGAPPYLPRVGSKDGQYCLGWILQKLEEFAAEAQSLEPNRYFIRNIAVGGRKISLILTRAEGRQVSFKWEGGSQVNPAAAIASSLLLKAGKHYSKPSIPFWLLAYSSDTFIADGTPELALARQTLARNRHPFDVAWFLNPFPGRDAGSLLKLWPEAQT